MFEGQEKYIYHSDVNRKCGVESYPIGVVPKALQTDKHAGDIP